MLQGPDKVDALVLKDVHGEASIRIVFIFGINDETAPYDSRLVFNLVHQEIVNLGTEYAVKTCTSQRLNGGISALWAKRLL